MIFEKHLALGDDKGGEKRVEFHTGLVYFCALIVCRLRGGKERNTWRVVSKA